MASTYSTSLRIQLIGTGEQSGVWGSTTNTNLGTLIEQAITGVQTITLSGTSLTLTSLNGVVDQARNAVLIFNGSPSGAFTLTTPAVPKLYVIYNNTTGGYSITITTGSGSTIIIPAGSTYSVYCDGTNYYNASSYNAASVAITGGTINGTTIGDITPSTGAFTTLSATSYTGGLAGGTGLPISTGVSGLGSNVATFLATPSSANLAAALTDETGTGSVVFNTSPTLVTPILGSPQSGNFSLGSFTWPIFNQNTTGTAGNITGVVSASNGGTGVSGTLTGVLYGNGTSAHTVATASQIVSAIGTTAVTNATNATNSTKITNSGGWSITPSGTTLEFSYNGTNVASLDSSGNFSVLGNVTAYATGPL